MRSPVKPLNRFPSVAAWVFLCAAGILNGGQYAASFLESGVGARALGMGSAFCALADDGHAFYWNPAGLALVRRPRLSAMTGPQFGSIASPLAQFHFIGYAQPLPGDVLVAVNWIRLSVDDIPVYSELDGDSFLDRLRDRTLRPSGDPEGYIRDTEDAYFFSFSKRNEWTADLGWLYHQMKIELPLGINIKWIKQSLGGHSATGLGIDLGAMIRFHLNDFFQSERVGVLAFGIQVQDMTRTSLRWDTKHQDSVPVNIKFGTSYRMPLPLRKNALHVALDRDTRWGGRTHFGIEYRGFDVFSLRIGSDGGRFTGGAGLRLKSFEVDYAFLAHPLDALHRLGCSLSF